MIREIKRIKPKVIINCAAMTNLELCELHPVLAYHYNVYGTKNVSEAAKEVKAFMVHISTNYAINPLNEYSWSKLAGESMVKGLIIRMTYYNNDYWIIKAIKEGRPFKALTTTYYNPISSKQLVHIVNQLIKKKVTGIINVGTPEKITPYAFAKKAGRLLGNADVEPIKKYIQYPKRPKDVYLDISKLKKLGIKVIKLEQDLEESLC
jgi:dTDP-4-dehydrorhamnose reductase